MSLAAARDESLATIAREQLAEDLRIGESFLRRVARRTSTRWQIPVPTLSRVLVAGINGVLVTWILDRDNDLALATLDALAAQISVAAGPRR